MTLRRHFAPNLPRVTADRVQIQQVIHNLLTNAVEAMDGIERGERRIVVRTSADEGGGVRFSVQDTGIGVAANDLERMFDPFHTTKNGGMEIAQNTREQPNRLVTRQTVPPAQPLLEIAGTARGQSDDDPRTAAGNRSQSSPDRTVAVTPSMNVPPPATRSAASSPTLPPPVRLGLPEFGPAKPVAPQAASKGGAVGQGN